MNSFLLRALVAGTVLALPVSAQAISLSNSDVSRTDICAVFDCLGATPMTDTFDFNVVPGNNDGEVSSVALAGLGGSLAEGYYLYGYQVTMYDTADDAAVHGFGVVFPELVDSYSFQCSDCGGGSDAPSFANYTGTSLSFAFQDLTMLGLDNNEITPGDMSLYFGAISTMAPGIRLANMLDGGADATGPYVYAPSRAIARVPEAGTVLLMGAGLMGLALIGLRRERRNA
jgi:hypothetical protein